MVTRTLRASLACSLALVLAACSGGGGDPSPGPDPEHPADTKDTTVVAQGVTRELAPSVSADDREAFAAANRAFAFKLYDALRNDGTLKADQNAFFSPVSISLAMSMLYAGANGDTAADIAKAMEFRLPKERLFPAFDALELGLAARADEGFAAAKFAVTPPVTADYQLRIANSFWGEKTLTFEAPFLDTLATTYGAGVHVADFLHAPDAERVRINTWVTGETAGKIKDLIPSGSIDRSTRTVLVNAIHLKMPWAKSLSVKDPAVFTKADGSRETVPFLGTTASLQYAGHDGLQAVALPLMAESLEMIVVAPKAGELATFEASLGAGGFDALVAAFARQDVLLSLPKVSLEPAGISLSKALGSLGMASAFRPGADFTGVTKSNTFVSDVVHKATLGYDENGLEAAAATAVISAGSSASPPVPPPPVPFAVDRPYFIAVYDVSTKAVLFTGHVTDPSKTE